MMTFDFDDLRKLEDNWDSYHAAKPSPKAIDLAEKISLLLRVLGYEPQISPVPDGGVILQENEYTVEIWFKDQGIV